MSAPALAPPPFLPPAPDRVEECGVPAPLLADLALRHIRLQRSSSLRALARSMRLPPTVVEGLFRELRQHQLVDVEGMRGDDYAFRLTQKGRDLAVERSQLGHYAGPAPVSLADYHRAMRAQAARPRVTRGSLRESLGDLVIPDTLLDQLGPALITHRSIFLYGPTGNGKTSIAERLLRIYSDSVVVPYALEVDGHIVSLFDPVVHHELPAGGGETDPRWVVCRRPCIVVGGELVSSMLELRLEEATGIYTAPLQMKANGGILIIDDFGRQVLSPRELLNRWIVPLDRRVDYLTLGHGVKFQIPFELLVVFSTNLDPGELTDEAFLRRIHTKVYVDAVGPEAFDEIFRRVAEQAGLAPEPGSAAYLRGLCLRHSPGGLRACYPADVCEIVGSIAAYEGRPAGLTRPELDRAVGLYFTRNAEIV